MSFNNNVPLANQTIAQTTDPIRNNFAFLQTNLQTEHSFNGNLVGVDEGVHKKVSMPDLGGAPALPTGTDGLIFIDGGNLKYYDGTNTSNLTEASTATNGYQWIGRVLLQWGRVNGPFGSSANGTEAFNIPFSNSIYNMQITMQSTVSLGANATATVTGANLVQFTWAVNNANSAGVGLFYWIAIGR